MEDRKVWLLIQLSDPDHFLRALRQKCFAGMNLKSAEFDSTQQSRTSPDHLAY